MTHDVDCLVCGTCVADILIRPVSLATPVGGGTLIHVDPIDVTTGGIVCNTGIAMRRLGMRVAASSLVGADQWGSLIRSRLEAERLDTTALTVHPTLATSTTAVLIDPGGERSFAHHVGAPHAIDIAFLRGQLGFFAKSRLAVIGYFGLLPSLESVFAEAVTAVKSAGCLVAVETAGTGGDIAELAPALPLVDIYVPSLDEALHQTGLQDPRAIIDCYRGHGAIGLLGVKLGTRGTVLSTAAGEFIEIPCISAPGPVADTTGAGDSFLAGLLTGILRGLPTREAGLLGAATAACCVTGLGATAGLRSFDETLMLGKQKT
ncbi:MAG: PfkB family carbohydrate kinase [Planctomycetota bacterium]|jgi:sugar/nucleoside kinase (ribokinase family)|nr:PfkB family carbohydrate kinase [Planctomycetota bacterium]